ncbi:Spo0B domain-containing protein [Sporosarcina sp. Te-1]|uniref:Spo0B domain-containing protein n=1 Tax=Sporosarcina sp. Te-1 TaxID=2818390 RepID=UPI001A9DAAD0|nr:Spo0B domain-containing protein [Sporosarcina sp. Te-1]QTD41593.1 Spo0B domain-containing protein [Sporosarcina sp. Te-1]
MDTKNYTVTEALKFARHDFLNELQLILLYIDLDNKEEARNAILAATGRLRSMAMLERLRMPSVEKWLNTFDWVHTEFSKQITCDIVAADRVADDREVANYLEQVIRSLAAVLDPMDDYELVIHVTATDSEWRIQLVLDETVAAICPDISTKLNVAITETADHGQWTFTISGR